MLIKAVLLGAVAVLVATCSNADRPAPRPTQRVEPLRQGCDDLGVFYGDVNGDDRIDRIYHGHIERLFPDDPSREGIQLGVCTTEGGSSIDGSGMAEISGVIDVEPDGRDEILYGGTSVCGGVAFVAVFLQNDLVRVLDEEGHRLSLNSGGPCADETAGGAWGCSDVDGDGRREVTTVDLENRIYTRRSYDIVGAQARLVSNDSGRATRAQLDELAGGECDSITDFPDEDECRSANDFAWEFNRSVYSDATSDARADQATWHRRLRVLTRHLTSDEARAAARKFADVTTEVPYDSWPQDQRSSFDALSLYIRDTCGFEMNRPSRQAP